MKRLDSVLLKTFLYCFPVVLLLGLFSFLYEREFFSTSTNSLAALYSLTGLILALWMVLTVYITIRLLLSGPLRDKVLARIAFIKERDEREVHLTGKATKTTFLMTLALLFFLLCLSCFQVSVYRVPKDRAVNGKTGVLTLGINFNLLQKPEAQTIKDNIERYDIFVYDTLPISSTGIILLLII